MKDAGKPTSQLQFPCGNCGALQVYAPGTKVLRCPYCRHETPIPASDLTIEEYSFREALHELSEAPPRDSAIPGAPRNVECGACGASFEFDQDVHSGACPYCATPVVLGTEHRAFKPKSLLPFRITEEQARTRFRAWLRGLWFALGRLGDYARDNDRLRGIYVPYWTYDSATDTRYRGERGDYYQVRQRYVARVKGRRVTRTRTVTKVRWTPAQGSVSTTFDDVLVGATTTLPRRITDRLEPWDLEGLLPYQEAYLSGFTSQAYQIELDEGFDRAREIMDQVIRTDVARDIGGDVQRIHALDTRHRNTTFKHLLLPVWAAAFRYKDRDYAFVVNGRTGKVAGERPYSGQKILLAVLLGAVLAGGALMWYSQQQGGPDAPSTHWPPPAENYRPY